MDDAVVRHVRDRDRGCVPARLGAPGYCRNRFGTLVFHVEQMELDHVRGRPEVGEMAVSMEGGFGKRPPDDPHHLIITCGFHHETWVTSHRPLLREWIELVEVQKMWPILAARQLRRAG